VLQSDVPKDMDGLAGRLTAFVKAQVKPIVRPDGPGVAVGVRRGDSVLLRACFGQARLTPSAPLTPQTPMPIASVSKQFTAACAVALSEAGVMDLDARLGAYLPDLHASQQRPTLRLDHTSGLRCIYDLEFFSGYETPRPADFAWRQASTLTSVNAEPGVWRAYANSAYDLVALAIERAAGAPFADVLRATILAPLGLHHTVLVEPGRSLPGLAAVYTRLFGDLTETEAHRGGFGCGGLGASLDDLLAWTHALRTEDKRLSPNVWRALKQPSPRGASHFAGYGLGLGLQRWRGVDILFHGGDLPGVSAAQIFTPDAGVDVIVIANMETPVDPLARAILAFVIGDARLTPEEPFASAAEHQGLVGGVFAAPDLVIGFAEQDGRLTAQLQGLEGIPLRRTAEGMRYDGSTGALHIRTENASSIVVEHSGERHHASRLQPPDPARLADYTGAYVNAEFDIRIEVAPTGAHLTLTMSGPYGSSTAEARLVAPDTLNACGPYARFLLRAGRQGGLVKSLRFDSVRTRNLIFERQPNTSQEVSS
jgi:CubicO group peptidase (beta-lactamase class C family)